MCKTVNWRTIFLPEAGGQESDTNSNGPDRANSEAKEDRSHGVISQRGAV